MRFDIRLTALAIGAMGMLLAAPAPAQEKEQFFPLMSYRTGPFAPNGTPVANGQVDYLKMVNARDGGINGVKLAYEECETGYATDRGVECYERLKSRPGAVTGRSCRSNPCIAERCCSRGIGSLPNGES